MPMNFSFRAPDMESETSAPGSRVLSLVIGDRRVGIDALKVSEVIRRPSISRVPNGPFALVGLCNLRGVPLPVIDMRGILGMEVLPSFPGSRVVVYQQSEPVGLLVDEVLSLRDGSIGDVVPDLDGRLTSVVSTTRPERAKRVANRQGDAEQGKAVEQSRSFLAFLVAGQVFGLPLNVVEQVIAVPTDDRHDTRLTTFRGRVIPLVSLATLVGLPSTESSVSTKKIVVIEHDRGTVGLIVDGIEAILRLISSAIDPVPPLLKRSSGTAELEGVGRYDGGKSLVGILSPERLFNHSIVETALSQGDGALAVQKSELTSSEADEKFLLFGLGDETYGLPLEAIDEVIRLPDVITRVPHAPDFVLGVANLRGKALPLIDQRARFGASSRPARPRAIVMTVDGLQAGFAVDVVSEVVIVPVSDVSASPDFSSEATAVFDRVAHIKVDGRMVLVIDPRQLLSGSERDLISSVAALKESTEAP